MFLYHAFAMFDPLLINTNNKYDILNDYEKEGA
jgi:hypothetical protein